jgi:hypothetical protein
VIAIQLEVVVRLDLPEWICGRQGMMRTGTHLPG